MPARRDAALVACVVATLAFSVYTRTLLPGVDLGDTGGFQAAVLWPETSARQAYPLYYDLARPFVLAVSPDNPARGLNLFSALCGGLAVGLIAYVAALFTTSVLAGAVAGALLAFSHTFWTQSVIAEVYTLHIALIAGCLIALHAFREQPTEKRLAVFFAIYAAGFGNHLSMVLLFIPFALFLLVVHPRPLDLFRPRTVGMALGIACAGALLYAPNFLFVWTNIDAPPALSDRVATFWFDVTKADWRGTMLGGVDWSEWRERFAMWEWDTRMQFGLAGIMVASIGAIRLLAVSRPWATVILIGYAINTAFAITYNVGDPHVFFLPGHVFTVLGIAALFMPPPFVAPKRRSKPVAAVSAALVFAWSGYLAWDNWPSVDRHNDRRADLLVARVAVGVNDSDAVLVSDMDWQAENALLYSARYERPRLAWRRASEVLLHLPFFVNDNHRIGRDIVLTGRAAARAASAYGSLFPLVADEPPTSIAELAAAIPRGTPYVLVRLEPTGGEKIDDADFNAALTMLAGSSTQRSASHFAFWAGLAGERGTTSRNSEEPFRATFSLLGDPFSIRMESWLPFETFRRAGFGHVLRGREPILTIERGLSLVWLEADGTPSVAYAAGLYAPQARLRIPASVPQQVAHNSSAMLKTWHVD